MKIFNDTWGPSVPAITVPVYAMENGKLIKTRWTREVWSFAALYKDLKVIRTSVDELEKGKIAIASDNANSYLPSTYAPALVRAWAKWASTPKTRVWSWKVDQAFAKIPMADRGALPGNARLLKLLMHGPKSARVSTRKMRVAAINQPINDGGSYISEDAVPDAFAAPCVVKGMVSQYGFNNPEKQMKGEGTFITGMFEVVPRNAFKELCKRFGVTEKVDILTDRGNMKVVKNDFIEDATFIFFNRAESFYGDLVVSYQVLRCKRTAYCISLMKKQWKRQFEEHREILADGTGTAFLEKVPRFFEGEDIPEDWAAMFKSMAAGLPLKGKDVLNRIIPILSRKFQVADVGVRGIAMLDEELNGFDIKVPIQHKDKFPISHIGTGIFYPLVRAEAQNYTIVGYTYDDTIRMSGEIVKAQGKDFDGDTINIFNKILVHPYGLEEAMAKTKTETPKTIRQAVAQHLESNKSIGAVDSVVDKTVLATDKLNKSDGKRLIGLVLEEYQKHIDSQKFDVACRTVKDIYKECKEMGVDLAEHSLDSSIQYIRGKVGNGSLDAVSDFRKIVNETKSEWIKSTFGSLWYGDDKSEKYFSPTMRNRCREYYRAVVSEIKSHPDYKEISGMAITIRDMYGHQDGKDYEYSFVALKSVSDEDAYDVLKTLLDKLTSYKHADKVIMLLWTMMVYHVPGFVKSLALFSYFPPTVGDWDLAAECNRLNGDMKRRYAFGFRN